MDQKIIFFEETFGVFCNDFRRAFG